MTNIKHEKKSKASHTPGPWHHSPELSRNVSQLVYGEDKYLICNVGAFKRSDEENLANVRLIAAAPKLLGALTSAGSFISGFEGDDLQEGIDELLAVIRAAIAEATDDSIGRAS